MTYWKWVVTWYVVSWLLPTVHTLTLKRSLHPFDFIDLKLKFVINRRKVLSKWVSQPYEKVLGAAQYQYQILKIQIWIFSTKKLISNLNWNACGFIWRKRCTKFIWTGNSTDTKFHWSTLLEYIISYCGSWTSILAPAILLSLLYM